MKKRRERTRILALIGTVLVALPLLAPFVFGLLRVGSPRGFVLDYLMPFEVYPVTLVGVVLLLWATIRAHVRKGAATVAVTGMIGGLVLGSVAAEATGIAQSVERLEAWKYALTGAMFAVSVLAQIALVAVGALLSRDLVEASADTAPPVPRATGA
ncbi:MAG: hypothetical protein KJ747_08420 [Actinobacteria bacterium]|nr:hypothetical protein [Actinomycetota bacterium]MCG2808353.1 hypothetical protein [Coriobacteriia bacterium]